MDTALGQSSSGYLVGDRVTIADISCWGWVASSSTFLISVSTPMKPSVEYANLCL